MADFPPPGSFVVVREKYPREGRTPLIRHSVAQITKVWDDVPEVCEAVEFGVFMHVDGYPELGRRIPAAGLTGLLADDWSPLFTF